jgi:hypothetical protein
MPSDAIYQLITANTSVTAATEEYPTARILDIAHWTFTQKPRVLKRPRKFRSHDEFTKEDLDRAVQCGKFPYRPSDLFLMVRN